VSSLDHHLYTQRCGSGRHSRSRDNGPMWPVQRSSARPPEGAQEKFSPPSYESNAGFRPSVARAHPSSGICIRSRKMEATQILGEYCAAMQLTDRVGLNLVPHVAQSSEIITLSSLDRVALNERCYIVYAMAPVRRTIRIGDSRRFGPRGSPAIGK
jgi:hypothetical protein